MYRLAFKSGVRKDFRQISKADIGFIKTSLQEFVSLFDDHYERTLMQCGKIKKLQGQRETLYRLKLRRYRVIYKKENEQLVILVLSVKSREGAYKK
ncbi:MAG: hypothetical protein DSZ10_02755 [Sulfurovum sp.]|nr:MAG: hypothetical protein DSZ10_02755 [Sulfurovum sp.]